MQFLFPAVLFFAAQAYAADAMTLEHAHTIATRHVPGVVLGAQTDTHEGLLLYEVEVEKKDGTVMKVDIDAETGAVVDTQIKSLGKGAALPEAKLKPGAAEVIALSHIRKNTAGHTKPVLEKNEYTLKNGKTVYDIRVKKLFTRYEVIVDAETGNIIRVQEQGNKD
jgi:uncharacterized membrane protein YkoI